MENELQKKIESDWESYPVKEPTAPGRIAIGEQIFKVCYVENSFFDEDGKRLLDGQFRRASLEMYIAKHLHPEMIKEVVLHECLHGIDQRYCGDTLSEEQIRSLTYGVYDLIKSNPDLIAWLLHRHE